MTAPTEPQRAPEPPLAVVVVAVVWVVERSPVPPARVDDDER